MEGANAVRQRRPAQGLIELAGALVGDEHPQIEAAAPDRREVIGARHEHRRPTPARHRPGATFRAYSSASNSMSGSRGGRPHEGEADDGIVFDSDKDGGRSGGRSSSFTPAQYSRRLATVKSASARAGTMPG